jgi:hypothetical protein
VNRTAFHIILASALLFGCSEPPGDAGLPPDTQDAYKGWDAFPPDTDGTPGDSNAFDASFGDTDKSADGSLGGGSPCPVDGPAIVQLGPPNFSFSPWPEGAAIPLALGSEGGASVRFNLATWSIPEMVEALHIRVFLGTEKIADTTSTGVLLTCQPGGPGLLIQFAVNISSEVDVFSLIDQAGSIEVQLDFTGLDGPDTAETSHSGLFTLDF